MPISVSVQDSPVTRPHRASIAAASRAAFVVALGVFTVVFLANCWVGDDAFISFRVSDNLIHGFGPRWNVVERVQAFTNPLWTFLMAGVGLLSGGELFYTSMIVSFVLCVTMLTVAWRWLGRDADRWLMLVLLLSSKAFIDYSSSGLEYPLSYFLLTAFVVLLDRPDDPTGPHWRRVEQLMLLASLAFVNRADTILLYLPGLAWVAARWIPLMGRREIGRLVLATAPAWGWLLFALVYFGFFFPNTYYAKAVFGAPRWLQIQQGMSYVVSSIRFDPITLATIAVATGICWAVCSATSRALSLGACTYVLYTIWVGGDFMAGRFFALPFLLSTLLIARAPKKRLAAYAAAGLLVVLNVVNPIAPVKTIPSSDIGWNWRLQNGVKDERGAIFKGVNPLFHEVFRRVPDNPLAREARSVAASSETVFVHPWIGEIGYFAGPKKYIIDPNALSDPLLARLPVGQDFYYAFWVSHWTRALPAGYVESRRAGRNLIEDPTIHGYFDRILNVTTGPIFSASRWRDIVALNWGELRHFSDRVKTTQRLDYTAQVNNTVFATDVGDVDQRSGVIKTTGKAGYLLLGPGIPLSTGTYRIRWRGTLDRRAGSDVGFVQVCYDDCQTILSRTSIAASDDGQLAETFVQLKRDVRDIEFRMYVNQDQQITLHTVSIAQQ